MTIPGTFVEVELSDNAPLLKEGFVLRKNIMDAPHKKGGGIHFYCCCSVFSIALNCSLQCPEARETGSRTMRTSKDSFFILEKYVPLYHCNNPSILYMYVHV